MSMDDNDGQMIFGDLGGLKLPDICLTGEEKPRKNLTQETCPDRGLNPGPLRDKRACYHFLHSGGQMSTIKASEVHTECPTKGLQLFEYFFLELELIYLSGRVKAFRPFLPLNQSDTCTNNNKIS